MVSSSYVFLRCRHSSQALVSKALRNPEIQASKRHFALVGENIAEKNCWGLLDIQPMKAEGVDSVGDRGLFMNIIPYRIWNSHG